MSQDSKPTVDNGKIRKPYEAPKVVVHGDVASLTQRVTGPGRSDNFGGPKT